jgi:hypothetical protein
MEDCVALTFHVEDPIHQRLRTFSDDGANTFLNLCRRLAAKGTGVLDILDPYADTMLNYIQLDRIVLELREALSQDLSEAERSLALMVLAAVQEAREISGYLFVQGD